MLMCYTQIFDDIIVAKWKAEALSATAIDITESMFTWCIDELRYKSAQFRVTRAITAYDGDVVKSDTVIPSSLQDALKAAAAPLENVSEVYRDWHPGSENTVLDLVHPSLFPVVYGRTKILRDNVMNLDDCVEKCGEGVTLEVPPSEEAALVTLYEPDDDRRSFYSWNWGAMNDPYSRKFQWLPCEVGFEGDKVKYVPSILHI
jgi:hypothetical protein